MGGGWWAPPAGQAVKWRIEQQQQARTPAEAAEILYLCASVLLSVYVCACACDGKHILWAAAAAVVGVAAVAAAVAVAASQTQLIIKLSSRMAATRWERNRGFYIYALFAIYVYVCLYVCACVRVCLANHDVMSAREYWHKK